MGRAVPLGELDPERLALVHGDEHAALLPPGRGHAVGEVGDLADRDDAKRILISAFRMDTKDDEDLRKEWESVGDLRMGRGLRGEVVLLGAQSRDFKAKLARAFIAWLYAFGAEHDVVFKAWDESTDPETGEIA